MTASVDLQLIDGLGLSYAPGAEAALLDPSLDPVFNDAWQALVGTFPGQTLVPLFDQVPVQDLADLVSAVRMGGDEPPDPFVWFTLACDEAVADALVAAAQALPMVVFARKRTKVFVAANISYGTNPDAARTLQIQPAPNGVDAIYVWQVAGGAGDGARVADIEGGWRLDHEELVAANIRKLSVFGSDEVDHGTAVAGILVSGDNGVGTVGIVPNAEFDLVTENRGAGVAPNSLAQAILFAARALSSGDVLLLEIAQPFFAPPTAGADILVEADPAVQVAIGLATRRGVTVIEPAGNGGVNLDAFPFLAHTRPGNPAFVDSGAIVVGAGELTPPLLDSWSRTFSSFGSRVDCFAAGSRIVAPSSSSTTALQAFGGTSGASAIVAGVAASLQAMTLASTQATLAPADVRRLLGSASLGTLPGDPLGAKIGSMPDLRQISRARGLMRVLPIGAAAIGGNALLIVHLDADNHLARRHFTLLTGWGQPIPTPAPSDLFELTAAQPAVTSSDEVDPIARLVFDAFLSGPGGIHHIFWDSLNQVGDVTPPIAPFTAAAQGRALAAVRPFLNLVVLAAISPEGRLVVITGDPDVLLAGTSAPLVLDNVGAYRRVAGPTIVSRAAGQADIVTIEDGGGLSWFTGTFPATIGTGWSPRFTESSGVAFDPGARPALLAMGDVLLAAAVGTDGSLRATTIHPATRTVDAPIEVDPSVAIDTFGPVGLGRAGQNFVALGVDKQGVLRAATRAVAGGAWTPLLPVLSAIPLSPLGGVTAVTIDIGIMAIVVGVDGVVCSSVSLDGLIWPPLVPLP
ncbi:Subtilase family protein [Rhizobiales bacterium GAS191]|nr:Subtilase family protein [Rhizobiales bacterium GAS191]